MKKLLNYEAVVDAAVSLLREGRQPNPNAIVQHLGYGSKVTVAKYLEQWRESLGPTGFRLPPSFPEELVEPLEQFWTAAVQVAALALEFERQAFAEHNQALEAERDAATAARDVTEQDARATRTRLHERESALKEMREHIESLKTEMDALHEQARRAETAAVAERQRADTEVREAQQTLKHAQAQHQQDREALEAKLALTIERADSSERRWMQEIAATRDRMKEYETGMRDERKAFQEELKERQRTISTLKHERDRAQRQFQHAEERLAGLQQRLEEVEARAGAEVEAAQAAQTALQNRVSELERERRSCQDELLQQSREFAAALHQLKTSAEVRNNPEEPKS